MLQNLPSSTENLLKWTWVEIEPYYKELKDRPLTEENVNEWLKDWSDLSRHVTEINWRLEVLTTVDTSNQESEEAFKKFLDEIFPNMQKGENDLKNKLLDSGLEPKGFEIALRNMRAEAGNSSAMKIFPYFLKSKRSALITIRSLGRKPYNGMARNAPFRKCPPFSWRRIVQLAKRHSSW